MTYSENRELNQAKEIAGASAGVQLIFAVIATTFAVTLGVAYTMEPHMLLIAIVAAGFAIVAAPLWFFTIVNSVIMVSSTVKLRFAK